MLVYQGSVLFSDIAEDGAMQNVAACAFSISSPATKGLRVKTLGLHLYNYNHLFIFYSLFHLLLHCGGNIPTDSRCNSCRGTYRVYISFSKFFSI